MTAVTDGGQIVFGCCVDIQHFHGTARNHHASDRALVEFEQVVQHVRLFVFDFTMCVGILHQALKLLATEHIRMGDLLDVEK